MIFDLQLDLQKATKFYLVHFSKLKPVLDLDWNEFDHWMAQKLRWKRLVILKKTPTTTHSLYKWKISTWRSAFEHSRSKQSNRFFCFFFLEIPLYTFPSESTILRTVLRFAGVKRPFALVSMCQGCGRSQQWPLPGITTAQSPVSGSGWNQALCRTVRVCCARVSHMGETEHSPH